MKSNLKRLDFIDLIRGITILSMVAYHTCFDLVYLFNVPLSWFPSTATDCWQQSICITFIFLAGLSSCLSRSNLKRGIRLLLLAVLVSLGTFLVFPDELIVFGILNFMGLACILTALLRPLLNKCPALIGMLVCFGLFLLTKELPSGWLGIGGWHLIQMPMSLYSAPGMFIFGLPSRDFFSADYFPLIPWLFLFWTGYFFWRQFGERVSKLSLMRVRFLPVNWFGRHTIWVYVLHQPVIFAVLYAMRTLGFF
jgi:uncharacterized membrane protein